MIGRLTGEVAGKEKSKILLDVQGVGYLVTVSEGSLVKLPAVGQKATLLIYTAVRENDIALYGFLDAAEKEIFEKLLSVSGIGPKLAITILSGITPHDLARSVQHEDIVRLNAISGVGKKTAERLIVELKDKMIGFGASSEYNLSPQGKTSTDLVSALINLGYHRNIAERTISQIPLDGLSIEEGLKQALRQLQPRK